jgi:ArsR family transcriptional regulator
MPEAREVPSRRELEAAAGLAGALADPTRLHILLVLCERGEANVSELVEATGQPQSKVSRHLAYLARYLLVGWHRDRQYAFYNLNAPDICGVIQELRKCEAGLRPTVRLEY